MSVFFCARTGSSFLGTLMSEPDRAAYFYEPLKMLERPWKMKSDVWTLRTRELLTGLVSCNKVRLAFWAFLCRTTVKQKQEECRGL